jgi:hypothetical protein
MVRPGTPALYIQTPVADTDRSMLIHPIAGEQRALGILLDSLDGERAPSQDAPTRIWLTVLGLTPLHSCCEPQVPSQ